MGIEVLTGQLIGLDTAPLIYYFEDRAPYADILEPLFQSLHAGSTQIVTSMITITEVLVHPIKQNNEKLASEYLDVLLSHPHVLTIPLTSAIAQHAAELRANCSLKTPDSIQLATAIESKVTTFLTNDRDFADVPGIRIVRLSDFLTESA